MGSRLKKHVVAALSAQAPTRPIERRGPAARKAWT